MSTDRFNKIDYLRISVTDRCNLRCVYCIPEKGISLKPHEEILSFEEIVRLGRICASLGVTKMRLTGGEALIRKGICDLIRSLNEIDGIEEVSLTTNGTALSLYAEELKKAGLKRINISLDTLKEDRFTRITANSRLRDVFEGIARAKELSFSPLKLNMVVMRGFNDDEIIDFVEFALSGGLVLRFIEFMKLTPLWREDYFFPLEEVERICKSRFSLRKIGRLNSGPAEYHEVGGKGLIGFIKTRLDNCRACSRLRLTSTGELKKCLYEKEGYSLREFLRNGSGDDKIKDIIAGSISEKTDTDYRTCGYSQVYMSSIGG